MKITIGTFRFSVFRLENDPFREQFNAIGLPVIRTRSFVEFAYEEMYGAKVWYAGFGRVTFSIARIDPSYIPTWMSERVEQLKERMANMKSPLSDSASAGKPENVVPLRPQNPDFH